MNQLIRRTLPLLVVAFTFSAQAQFYKLHGGSVSVGATGQFSPNLTTDNTSVTANAPFGGGFSTVPVTISNRQQGTSNSLGFLTSLQFHPVAWAGIEVNYGFTHYEERYLFNYNVAPGRRLISVPTDMHEATAAYQFHAKKIPLQPFLNVGGGAIDFNPRRGTHEWRGTGLAELGIDIPTPSKHIAFRVEGRALFYRAPDYFQPSFNTQSWRATVQPSISSVYRF